MFPGHSWVQFLQTGCVSGLGKEAKWEVVCKELVECIIHTAPFQCGTTLTEN